MIKRLSEFGTSLGSASATGTNRDQLVIHLLPQAVPAGALPAPHVFDGRYSINRLALPPGRLQSKTTFGLSIRAVRFQSIAPQMDAIKERKLLF